MQRTIAALIVSVSASVAQPPVPPPGAPAPLAPPPANAPGSTAPAVPLSPLTPPPPRAGVPSLAPAPIDPPIQVPSAVPAPAPGEAVTPAPGVTALPATLDAGGSRVSEFQGDDISLVLRTLARQAKQNVVVSPAVTGQITLRVENKTPAEVMRIICQANGLIIDEMEGVFYIKTQAEKQKEPTESHSFVFSYATAATIAPLLQTQLTSGVAPQVDVRTNTIFFREGKSNLDKIMKFLDSVDSPTKQVMIEARLVEVTANPKQSYGLNWAGVVGGSTTPQTFKYGGSSNSNIQTTKTALVKTNSDGTTVLGSAQIDDKTGTAAVTDFVKSGGISNFGQALSGQFAILSVPQMSLTMRLLNEDSDAEFIANPRVVAANNEKATIKITRNQPVPQLNFNEQTAQAVFGGFQDKEFGNTLAVTPSINKDKYVSLKVQPEISNKVGDATFTFSGATVASPIIDKRTFDSNVLIKSGETLAIGGLLQDEITKNRTKVPVVGDIPLFGKLFQERTNARTKRNLLVFVTPNIINQGYGTGLEPQISGLHNSGEEFADPNGWRNNARGGNLRKKTEKPLAAEYPAPATGTTGRVRTTADYKGAAANYKVSASVRE